MADLGPFLSALVGAWLPAFMVHSTLLVGLAAVLTRVGPFRPWAVRDLVWKGATWGGLVTATVHVVVAAERVGPGVPPASPSPLLLWIPLALLVWLAVGVVLGVGAVIRVGRTVRALGRRRPVADETWAGLAEAAGREAGLRRPICLTVSDRLESPLALGRSEVCLPPRALALPEAERRALLAHEAWHLRRRDPLWGGASALAEAVLFVQPLLRLARLRREAAAEHVCDAHAAHAVGARAAAAVLVRVGGWVADGRHTAPTAPALGVALTGASLSDRVERLVEPAAAPSAEPLSSRDRRRWTLGLAVALVALGGILPAPGTAVLGGGRQLSAAAEAQARADFVRGQDLYYVDPERRNLDAALDAWLRVPPGSRYYGEARRLVGFNVYGRQLGRWPEARGYLAQAVLADPVGEGILEDAVRAAVWSLTGAPGG